MKIVKTFFNSAAIFAALFIINSSSSYAQSNGNVIQMQVVDDETESKSSGSTTIKPLLKISPSMFLRGDIPLYLEANFGGMLSLEFGAGVTLRDLWSEVFEQANDDWVGQETEYETNLGYSVRGSLRFYPNNNYTFNPEGLYLSVDYRRQYYQKELLSCEGLLPPLGNSTITKTHNDFKLSIGSMYYFSDNVFIDYWGGFGFRDRFRDEVTCTSSVIDITTDQDLIFLISMGFKIGIALN